MLASSAVMAAARACWLVVGDTLSMVARGCVLPAVSFSINYCMNTGVPATSRRGGRRR
jgi:hypothetical protein